MRAFTDTPVWNRPIAEISWDPYLGGEGCRTPASPPPGTFHGSGMIADAAISRRMLADVHDGPRRGLRRNWTTDADRPPGP